MSLGGHGRPGSSTLVDVQMELGPGRGAGPRAPGQRGPSPTVAFIINRTRVRDPDRFAHACRATALARGWAPMFLPTTHEDHGEGLARHAVRAGAELVFAVGGDGTVRACASVLAGTGVRLAIVPRGTANLAARALRVPRRLGAALATGFGDHETVLDLGLADGTPFTAMAGIGLDAAVVEATRRMLKVRLGWVAYAHAGLPHLLGAPSEFTITMDGGPPLHRAARRVVVGNAGLLPGGFPLLPDARPDDGLLDVGILAPASLYGWAHVGYRVITRSRHNDQHLERFRARHVQITTPDPLPRETDGEIISPGASLEVSLRPASLIVRTRRRPGG